MKTIKSTLEKANYEISEKINLILQFLKIKNLKVKSLIESDKIYDKAEAIGILAKVSKNENIDKILFLLYCRLENIYDSLTHNKIHINNQAIQNKDDLSKSAIALKLKLKEEIKSKDITLEIFCLIVMSFVMWNSTYSSTAIEAFQTCMIFSIAVCIISQSIACKQEKTDNDIEYIDLKWSDFSHLPSNGPML